MYLSGVKKIREELVRYQTIPVFSGSGIGFFSLENKELDFSFTVGKNSYDQGIDRSFFFDLASLTKPLLTLLSLSVLSSSLKISFQDSAWSLFDRDFPADKKNITIKDLLSHRAGFLPHIPLYEKIRFLPVEKRKEFIFKEIIYSETRNTGEYIYSDLDYILLGFLIEKLTGMDLPSFWKNTVLQGFNITKDCFYFSEERTFIKNKFVKTGTCPWSTQILEGIVHDDNCRAYGKTMGHAGLFSTLDGLISLCRSVMELYEGVRTHPFIEREILLFLASHNYSDEHWSAGFDVPTGINPSCGKYFSRKNTIGHLGYTGTSFWLDLDKKVGIVFLTNRVLCDSDGKWIRRIRPEIHNKIMELFA